jgi:hypothetical protein
MQTNFSAVVLGLVALGVIGCGTNAGTYTGTASAPAAAPNQAYLLTEAPADAKPVVEVREAAQDGDEVTIIGRVGGAVDPWVAGRASFLIVDPSLVPCSEKPDDHCPTPWDYCCDSDRLPVSMATIKIVDEAGQTVPQDAKSLLGLKELARVTIRGQAKRDEAGNLVVLAKQIHIAPEK